MRSLLIFLVPLLATAPALAETCKYVDNEGRIIYSNIPIKRARKVTCFEAPAPPPEPSPRPAAPPPGAADAARPPVEPVTLRKCDQDRRTILEDELAREQKALAEARKSLAEQETLRARDERNYGRVQERLKPYQEAIAAHEKNITSIRQELASAK